MKHSKVYRGATQEKPTQLNAVRCVVVTVCALINLTGCVTTSNGFGQFYQDMIGTGITNVPPYSGTTEILVASNPTNDVKDLYRNGFVLLGTSAFQGPPQPDVALMSQAKKVGADFVLLRSAYLGSHQAAVPWVQYNPGQTYTTASSGTVNATAWGGGGYAYGTGNYFGTSTTTTPGTFSTQVIPLTVHRYEYEAGFFRRKKPPILGVLPQPLPPEIRQKLERNTGAFIWVVMAGSPAFNANILEGDVILKINGLDVLSDADSDLALWSEQLRKSNLFA